MTRGRLFGVELPVREPIQPDKRRKRRAKGTGDPKRDADAEARNEIERLAEKLERYTGR